MKAKLHPHERAARVIRLMGWLGLLMGAGIVAAMAMPLLHDQTPIPLEFYAITATVVAIPTSLFFVAKGIFAQQEWARWAGIAYSILSLFGIPIGAFIGGYVLWQLKSGWPSEPRQL